MSMFNLNTSAKLQAFHPKRGRGDDAVVSCELQLRGAVCLPSACAAAALADETEEFERAIWKTKAEDPNRALRFYGITELPCDAEFEAKHHVTLVKGGTKVRCALVSKIVLRPHPGGSAFCDLSVFLEDPDQDLVTYLLEHINDTIPLILEQSEDLVDQMRASKQSMSATVKTGDLLEDQEERDRKQLEQAANSLGGSPTGEIPQKSQRGKKAPAKKAAGKRAPKKKAAA